jgi:hypothetical protein
MNGPKQKTRNPGRGPAIQGSATGKVSSDSQLHEPSREVHGLTQAALDGELDALAALEGALGGVAFWNPAVLSSFGDDLLSAYIRRAVGADGTGGIQEVAHDLLEHMKRLKEKCDPMERLKNLGWGARSTCWTSAASESAKRAMAYSAGLPLELRNAFEGEFYNIDLADSRIAWLPNRLKVHANLSVERARITELPEDLEVDGDLFAKESLLSRVNGGLWVGESADFEGCPIESLPNQMCVVGNLWVMRTRLRSFPKDLRVDGRAYIAETPMADQSHSIEELVASTPGVFEIRLW